MIWSRPRARLLPEGGGDTESSRTQSGRKGGFGYRRRAPETSGRTDGAAVCYECFETKCERLQVSWKFRNEQNTRPTARNSMASQVPYHILRRPPAWPAGLPAESPSSAARVMAVRPCGQQTESRSARDCGWRFPRVFLLESGCTTTLCVCLCLCVRLCV